MHMHLVPPAWTDLDRIERTKYQIRKGIQSTLDTKAQKMKAEALGLRRCTKI